MKIRRLIEKAVMNKLVHDRLDATLVRTQIADIGLGRLCDMSDGDPEFIENRAVFSCAGYKIAIVLWVMEYVPWTPSSRDESYDAAPMIMGDLPAYNCPITGKMITSRSHHRDNLKRHGCEVAEPNSKRDNWAQEKADDHSRKKLINDILSSNGYH